MDKKSIGLIALVTSTVLCGLPGLIGALFGGVFVLVGAIPEANVDVFGSANPTNAFLLGGGILCLSMIGVVIPILIGFFTLRKPKVKAESDLLDEPIPPAE